jgi:hypothetical protein
MEQLCQGGRGKSDKRYTKFVNVTRIIMRQFSVNHQMSLLSQ